MTPDQRERLFLATHEAGHAALAVLNSCDNVTAKLTPGHAHREGLCAAAAPEHARLPEVAFGGAYAEAMARHGGPPTSRQITAALAAHPSDAQFLTASGDPRPRAVPRIVTATWDAISSLALAIFQRGEIGQSDIDTALSLPDAERDPEARAHAISAIRSGQVPGTFAVSGTHRPHWMD